MRELFEMIDVIPVERGQQSDSVAALAPALEHLEQGNIFGIYPEARAPATVICTGAATAWRTWPT